MIRSIYILIFVCLSGILLAQTIDKDKLKKNKQQLQQEISQTNKLLKQTKQIKQSSLNKLIILNNQIQKREALIKNTNTEIVVVSNSISAQQQKVNNLKSELENLKKEYAQMIQFAYKNKNSYDRLMFIFASEDFYQAYKRMRYIQQYTEQLKNKGFLIQHKTNELNQKIVQLNTVVIEKKDLLTDQEQEKLKLAKEKTEQNLMYKDLQKKEKQLLATLRQKEEAARKLQKAIETIIANEIAEAAKRKAAEVAKAKATAKTTTTPAAVTTPEKATTATTAKTPVEMPLTPEEKLLSDNFVLNKGKLPWPTLKGTIVGSFGEHEHPVLKGIKTKNNGIDIATVPGSSARAIFDGTVTGVINIPGSGKAVIIKHGEYWSVYSNLLQVSVAMGAKVKTKQEIGIIDTDSMDNRTELHFEIWKGKLLLNPTGWVSPLK